MNTSAPPLTPLDGVLLVDKPADHTSHDVVARIRKRFRIAKVGHGGTLDPSATGLLVILLGKATKISDRVMGHDKTYEGTLRLGIETDTQDAEGRIVSEAPPETVAAITADALRAQMEARLGDQMQTPPMVSAIKVGGVPLYKLHHQGETVDRKPRFIHIYRFDLLDFAPPTARFRVECTKGTYIRTLVHDIGQSLGCGAHLASLRRLQSGPFTLDAATPLETLLALPDASALAPRVIPLPAALAMLP
jgi:tRNA pseudouridine55 synthase